MRVILVTVGILSLLMLGACGDVSVVGDNGTDSAASGGPDTGGGSDSGGVPAPDVPTSPPDTPDVPVSPDTSDCGPCDDGNACNGVETCDPTTGNCVAGDPLDCDDGNPCTDDSCDASSGCVNTNHTRECDDGNQCTVGDVCAEGDCVPGPNKCPCQTDAECGEDDNLCDGQTVCDEDGTLTGDVANANTCQNDPATVVVCDATGDTDCVANTCVPATGACEVAARADGLACDDGNACTASDECAAGGCGGTPVDCDDGDPCTDDSCDSATGCVNAPMVGGTACGVGMECHAGECVPGCDGVACPALAGYAVSCNTQDHCEHARSAPIASGSYGVLIWVPPSTFPMGSPDWEGDGSEYPQHDVTFAEGYFVDKVEVTAEAFAAFLTVRADNDVCSYGGGTAECLDADAEGRNVDWDGSVAEPREASCQALETAPANQSCASHPVVQTTWYGAGAFCVWVGGRLCTEAEWERAAKGTSHAAFPWGMASPSSSLANCAEADCYDGFDLTSPEGSFPDGMSPVGALDMAGNVIEWVEDDWHGSYAVPGLPDDGTAWVESQRATDRVRRGGSWDDGAAALRASFRYYYYPPDSGGYLGFRCCRSHP